MRLHRNQTKLLVATYKMERERGRTTATAKRTCRQLVNTERAYAERDMKRTAKTNWTARRGRPHEVFPMIGWLLWTIMDVLLFPARID
jgi:hypothetical protein